MHLILSDEINSGKSTFVLALASDLIESGAAISGWITPAHMEGGVKAGHDIVLLREGHMEKPLPFTRLEPFEGSFPWRRYHFNKGAFEEAARLNTKAPLFIMDEIGPLELEERKGFVETFEAAISQSASTLTVVRKELMETTLSIPQLSSAKAFTLSQLIDETQIEF